jgi:hypothetical protein
VRTRPPPAAGDLWVLFLEHSHGRRVMIEALSVVMARRLDPRVAAYRMPRRP